MPRVGGVQGVLASLVLWCACGPNDEPRDRCRLEPTFIVTVTPERGTFPPDTHLVFVHGSGTEEFDLNDTHVPQVVFCEAQSSDSGETAAGAGGTGDAIDAIVCKLWTGGATKLSVTASGFDPIEEYSLRTDRDLCTVEESIELPRESATRF